MFAFPGNAASVIYTVESSGALAAAASGPTYTLYKNGSVVDTTSGTPTVTLTATTIATGVYRVSYTVPGSGFAVNDVLELFAATGSTGSAVVGRWVILPASLLTLPSFPANFESLGINSSGHISRVTLVDTTTVNTDMRGTDGAYTGTPPSSSTIASAVWSNATRTLSEFGFSVGLTSDYNAAKTAASQTSVDNLLTTAMTESYPAVGQAMTLAQALYVLVAHLEEASISGTTKTIKKRDQSTTAETLTLNSATAPTSVTRAT